MSFIMKKILNIMWKDINVQFRDWGALVLMIAAPLVLTVGLGLITGSFNRSADAPTISRIPMLIVDQDGGQLAVALIDVFQSEGLSELVAPEQWNDEPAALEAVRIGEAAALIVIPAGFSDSFIPDAATGILPEPVVLRVYGDPGSPIGAGVVRSITDEFTTRAQTGVTAIQISMSQLAASGAVAPAELPEIGRALGERLLGAGDAGAAGTAPSSLIRVRSESIATSGGEADFNPLSYFAPAMALLFLMYAVSLGARTLLTERREGTLARMLAAPVTPAQVLSGKVLGIFMTGFIQLAVLILLTTTLFQLNWGNPFGVLIVIVSAALAATGWGLLIAAASANAGQVASLGMALTLIFGILGGSFVQITLIWPGLETISRITPNSWAMDGFLSLALGEGLSAIITPVVALLVMAAILFTASAVVFRRRQSALLAG